jgi:hypothetical protein
LARRNQRWARAHLIERVEDVKGFPGTEWADKGRGFETAAVTPSAARTTFGVGAVF